MRAGDSGLGAQFRRLGKHSAVYGLSNVLVSAAAVFLLPLYTRFLTPHEYGIFELLTVSGGILASVLQLGMGTAVFKAVQLGARDREDEAVTISTAFYFVAGTSLAAALAFWLLAPALAPLVADSREQAQVVRLLLLKALVENVALIPLATLRIREQSTRYAALNLARTGLSVGLAFLFLAVLKTGLHGLAVAAAIEAAAIAAAAVYMAREQLGRRFSRAACREMLDFGLPLVPLALALIVINLSDRYFLRAYASFEELGRYAVGYRIGMLVAVLIRAFQVAWPAVLFSVAKRDDAKVFFARLLTYLLLVLGFAGLVLAVFAREAVLLLATPEYLPAAGIVPLVVLANLFSGVFYATPVGANLRNRVGRVAWSAAAAAACCLVFSWLLIPRYGATGAALATVGAQGVLAAASCAASLRLYWIDYEWGRILKIAVAGGGVYALGTAVRVDPAALDVALRAALVAAFPLVLYLTGFFSTGELRRLRSALGGRFPGAPRTQG